MGHQELKLAVAGLEDDRIAALDGDWSEFNEAERAAFAFAKLLTHQPHRVAAADLERVRKHYTDLQILEMLFSISGNNSTTRWKEAIGVPQERDASGFRAYLGALPTDRPLPLKSYITPTSERYLDIESLLAPKPPGGEASLAELEAARRPPLESRSETEQALTQSKNRSSRLPLVDDERTRAVMGEAWAAESYPRWARLLANFPIDGKARILTLRAAEEKGDVAPLLKAQVAWIAARENRAWYSLGRAKAKLRQLGLSEDEIYKLDGPWDSFTAGQRAAFHLTRRLMRAPDLLTDEDVARVVETLGDRDTVQLISHITNQAFLNRLTETAGLPLDPS